MEDTRRNDGDVRAKANVRRRPNSLLELGAAAHGDRSGGRNARSTGRLGVGDNRVTQVSLIGSVLVEYLKTRQLALE